MDKDMLLALAERCEKATGPDCDLDGALRKAVFGDFWFCGDEENAYLCGACCLPAHELTQEPGCGAPIGLLDERRSYPSPWSDDERLPAYTASLDAAMTLVPEGWLLITLSDIKADGLPWCVLGRPEDAARAEGIANHDKVYALCAAALRARANPCTDTIATSDGGGR